MRYRLSAEIVLPLLLVVTLAQACNQDNEPAEKSQPPLCETSPVTYEGTVKAIMEQHCSIEGCHTTTKGGAFPLDTYEQVKASALYESFIGSLTQIDPQFEPMPYPKGTAKISDEEINCLEQWINDGWVEN